MVDSYDPFGEVLAISYKPSLSNTLPNFVCVDGKFKVSTRFVEPKWPWGAPACDPQAGNLLPRRMGTSGTRLVDCSTGTMRITSMMNCGSRGRSKSRQICEAMG